MRSGDNRGRTTQHLYSGSRGLITLVAVSHSHRHWSFLVVQHPALSVGPSYLRETELETLTSWSRASYSSRYPTNTLAGGATSSQVIPSVFREAI